jgi:cell volume regulation protein A
VDAYADFFPDLLAFSVLLLIAIAAAPLAARVGLPGPAAFLGVGIVAGATDLIPTDELGPLHLEQIASVALFAILFQGGISTGVRALRPNMTPTLVLALPGTAATAAGLAAVGHYAFGLDWTIAALVGVALAPTDPAAVYAVLRRSGGGDSRARTILEAESGFNDPVGISLMVAVLAYVGPDEAGVGGGFVRFAQELGIGSAVGIAAGLLLIVVLRATKGIPDDLQGIGFLSAAIGIGALSATIHGSGFLAVYIAGLLVSDAWREQDGSRHVATEGAAAIAEPLLFGMFGAAFASSVGWAELGYGVGLIVALALIVRPPVAFAGTMGAGLSMGERRLVAWGGLKGAVPLLLAAYPALEALDDSARVQGIVLVATAGSILLQGATLAAVAKGAVGARAEARAPTKSPATGRRA